MEGKDEAPRHVPEVCGFIRRKIGVVFQPSLGLYISQDSADVVLLGKSFSGVRVVATATRSLDKDSPAATKIRAGASLLNEFTAQHRIRGGSLHVGLASDQGAFRYLSLPLAVKENIRASLGYEMENYIPISAEDVFFDYQVLGEDKAQGMVELLLVVTRRENVLRVVEVAEEFGRKIDGLELGAVALANAVSSLLAQPEAEAQALVFIGDSWAEMAFTRKGRLVYGTEIEGPDGPGSLADSIKTHLERTAHAVGLGDSHPELVVLGPGASEDLMDEMNSRGLNPKKVEDIPRVLCSHGLVLAYGLAIRPFLKLPASINLLPSERRRRPSRASQYVMIVLCGLLVMSLTGWWGSGIVQQRRMARHLDRQLARLEKQVKQVEINKNKCEELARQLKGLQKLIWGPVRPLDVLKELTERIPEDAWLSSVVISDHKVTIYGYAKVATELIPILENSPLFHNVAFLSSVSRTRDGKERFRIGLETGQS